MLKGNELIGMPIVAYDTGEQVKVVTDLIFDQQCNLLGFLVNSNFWSKEVLPFHSIKVIGAEAIVALSQSAIVKAKQVPSVRDELQQDLSIQKTKVLTEEGRNLGTITDVYLDKETGAILGYEVRGGLFANLSFGTSFVPAPANLKLGKDVAFVPEEVAELMNEKASLNGQGLESIGITPSFSSHHQEEENTEKTNGKVLEQSANAVAAVETPSQLIPTNGHTSSLNVVSHSEYTSTPEVVTTLEPLLGRRVLTSVYTEERFYIAAQGQIVTQAVIDCAWTYNKEKDLVVAVCSPLQKKQSFLDQKNLQSSGNNWKKPANQPYRIKEKLTKKQEERQIEGAIGYRTNRVILDHEDNILLPKGEIITYSAIERARQANVLTVLLTSVAQDEN